MEHDREEPPKSGTSHSFPAQVAVIDGVQLWQLDAGIKSLRMLLCHNLSSGSKDGSDEVANPETAVFARGIARSQRGRHVCVGCSSGAVLVFGTAEPEVDVQLERWVPAHGSPVTAVAASTRGDDVVVSADEAGELRLWELPSFTPRGRESDGKDRGLLDAGDARDPCTGLALVGAAACCGAFASGHVRVYDLASSYGKLAELQAHTRCVTALAVDDKGLELATVSEDSFLHVWSLEPRDGAGGDEAKADGADPSLALTYSHQVTDAVLTGVQFVAPAPGAGKAPDVAVTAYDVDAVSIWTRD